VLSNGGQLSAISFRLTAVSGQGPAMGLLWLPKKTETQMNHQEEIRK
jgi:hypothetical protein